MDLVKPRIAVLPGDGIGPEVTGAALSVLGACLPFDGEEAPVGGAAIDRYGDPLPESTLDCCRRSDAVLLGAVGGPDWQGTPRPEDGLLRLRRELGLYVNLRPARFMGVPTPLREGLARGADLLVVRDLAGGVYFGEPRGTDNGHAFNTWRQSADQVRRVAHVAFGASRRRRRRVVSVDKANVLETSRLWRGVVEEVAREYPDVRLEHRYIDAASFELLRAPQHFDVVLAENLFGDILSDEVAAVAGSIGLLPSASLGDGPPLFEPVHGSAPDLAGRGVANPTGAILSVALLLEYALQRPDLARAIEAAVVAALRDTRTADIGGNATTSEFTQCVRRRLARPEPIAWSDRELEECYGWGV
jgi:3-isopropylmalate dehydrogenase